MERVIMAGTGGFGRTWWPGLAEPGGAYEVVAVVEPDAEEREAARTHFGLPRARALDVGEGDWALLGATLVIDSSPFVAHPANAERAVAADLDLLVAKPMAATVAEATVMVETASHAGRLLGVAQQMRYFPCFLALRDVLAAGTAGRPLAARLRMALDGRGWIPGMQWRLAMDHPLLLEAAIHHFDLLRFCLGTEFEDVAAMSWNPPWSPFAGDATVAALMRGANGGAVVDYGATFAPGEDPPVRFDSGWDVVCSVATLRVRDGGLYLDGQLVGGKPATDPVPLEELNRKVLADWTEARATGTEPPFSGADNLRSLRLVEQAIAATARNGADRRGRTARADA